VTTERAVRRAWKRNDMAVVTMRQMLESGVHFGHQTRRWNPKMKRFILTERNGIYIIDLSQSLTAIDRAYAYVKETVTRGGSVMFIGTKKQAQEAVAEQATRVGMPYVNERWLGGMLTNFQTVHKRLQRLKELEQIDFDDVAGSGMTKKELLVLRREKDKLERTLGGIRDPQAGHPGHRHPGLQLRPGRGRLPDPRQRRRDPRRGPAHPCHRRCRR
jgi:small subunit ribosomal protein S2